MLLRASKRCVRAAAGAANNAVAPGRIAARRQAPGLALRHCGGSSGAAEEQGDATAAPREPVAPRAQRSWTRAVGGVGPEERYSPDKGLFGTIQAWAFKRAAMNFTRTMASAEEGRWETMEEDVREGAPLILQFLVESLEAPAGGRCRAESSTFGPPHVEEALAEALRDTVVSLKEANVAWQWRLHGTPVAKVERLFVIVGASRSRGMRQPEILSAFGQQFVMTPKQRERFFETGVMGRTEVLQELLMTDMVLVADASLSVLQQSSLAPPNDDGEAQQPALGPPEKVEHILRLESQLSVERGSAEEGVPVMRPSPWQVVDWNWLCKGNHPALPRGHRAPFTPP